MSGQGDSSVFGNARGNGSGNGQSPPRRRHPGRSNERKRVLVVNAFMDEYRRTRGSPFRVPRAMGPVYLAGVFSPALCDVRIYSEQYSGVLKDTRLLAWADMLVMTGVTTSFDRMLQLTAYARTLNPQVVVVAGGPPVRALPKRARRFFDYACTGDIEELQSVVREVFGPDHVANDIFPRYDLAPKGGIIGYVESSRACNFRCTFCSLTGEKARYQKYDLDYVRRQILAVGNKQLIFIDNNFYGNDRSFFLARLEMIKELYEQGHVRGWSALVTGDFFGRPENLELMREAGCKGLFSGVESFDTETLKAYNKKHNTLIPQVELISSCLEAGIVFTYGVMFDPSSRRLADLRQEVEFILATPEITVPAFFTLAIPLLGTPYFGECMDRGLFFPNTRLRHLDGVTLAMRPLDGIDEVLKFVRDLPSLRGYRGRVLRHARKFLRHYRGTLNPLQLYAAGLSGMLICTTSAASSPLQRPFRRSELTYFGPTETLDAQYTPTIRMAASYEAHFRPTMVSDASGGLAEDLAEDLA